MRLIDIWCILFFKIYIWLWIKYLCQVFVWAHILCQVDAASTWLLSCTECSVYRKWPCWHEAIISCFVGETDPLGLLGGNRRGGISQGLLDCQIKKKTHLWLSRWWQSWYAIHLPFHQPLHQCTIHQIYYNMVHRKKSHKLGVKLIMTLFNLQMFIYTTTQLIWRGI